MKHSYMKCIYIICLKETSKQRINTKNKGDQSIVLYTLWDRQFHKYGIIT